MAHLNNFSFEFFIQFLHKILFYFFYTMEQEVKNDQKLKSRGPALRQDPPPLEAILVIFGRRALIFFLFESSWKKMKNDATFVRMRSGDHLGDAKMSKKGTSLRRI